MQNFSIYFYGIGGVSMSALAKLCASLGASVCGSDDNDSNTLLELKKHKINVFVGVNYEMLAKCDYFVYTVAVGEQNFVVQQALKLGKHVYERAEFLGIVAQHYKHVIAISGTHGKTTTTAMLGKIFETAGYDPTVHIGGVAIDFGENLRIGGANYFITEACEFNRSMLALSPESTIITNIERDHMDTYSDLRDIENAFTQFATQTKKYVVINGDKIDKKVFDSSQKIITFGLKNSNDYYALNLQEVDGKFSFDCYHKHKLLGNIKLNIMGEHNVLNALACVVVARQYKIKFCDIAAGISGYNGVKRRLTLLKRTKGINIYHDYAHHPTEIAATLDTLKLLDFKRIIAVFQPHTYSRTKALMGDFVSCFSNADFLIILPTYAARENYIMGGDALDLFYNLGGRQDCAYFSNYEGLQFELDKMLTRGDCLVWLGAGDIDKIAEKYKKHIK